MPLRLQNYLRKVRQNLTAQNELSDQEKKKKKTKQEINFPLLKRQRLRRFGFIFVLHETIIGSKISHWSLQYVNPTAGTASPIQYTGLNLSVSKRIGGTTKS